MLNPIGAIASLLAIVGLTVMGLVFGRELFRQAARPLAYGALVLVVVAAVAAMALWAARGAPTPIVAIIEVFAVAVLLSPERLVHATGGPVPLEPLEAAVQALFRAIDAQDGAPVDAQELHQLLAEVRATAPWGAREYAKLLSDLLERDLAGLVDDPASKRVQRFRVLDRRVQRWFKEARRGNPS